MSDENSELDEIDFNSEIGSSETYSNASNSPPRIPDANNSHFDFTLSSNVVQNLFRREAGYGHLKPIKQNLLRSYHLRNVFPHKVLLTHVFMGMTKCGRFLITYTMITDQDDDEWYATVYKYRLHWWIFKPGSQVRKIAEVSLFGNYKIVAPLQLCICQWPQDYEKILVYGFIRESGSTDVSAPPCNQHAFVTVTALPSVNNCQDCRVVASSYMLDDIAASWDTCLRFSCLKHGYTVHTSFDVVVPYPEFVPKISLKCHDYAVFNTNNFLYALKISLENCDKKQREDLEELPYQLNFLQNSEPGKCDEPLFTCSENSQTLTTDQKRALNIKEQIIRDFSEEINLSSLPFKKLSDASSKGGSEDHERLQIDAPCRFLTMEEIKNEVSISRPLSYNERRKSSDLPLPTRITHFENFQNIKPDKGEEPEPSENLTDDDLKEPKVSTMLIEKEKEEKLDESMRDCNESECFRCPKSSSFLKSCVKREKKTDARSKCEIRFEKSRKSDVYKGEKDCSKKYYKSFFTRHKVSKGNFGMFIRSNTINKPFIKPNKTVTESEIHSSDLESRSKEQIFGRNLDERADSEYEFVDDSQHEVEKLSQFRKKRLAEKKYEFQDFDSENIVPFSIVRQENTLRSPRKSTESDNTLDRRISVNLELRFSNESVSSTERTEMILRSPSPRFPLDLSISVPSPRSPLVLEVLSSPTQYEGVLRPFNRNTSSGNPLLSPMAKYLTSPPNAQKLSKTKDCMKSKGCDDFKTTKTQLGANKISTKLDTRLILENGILINDISERYFKEGIENVESDIYNNLFRNLNKFHGEAVRFERRFVEVDDELVSVITDIEDDDMSTVTGYHTALNLEVHGAGYVQLQMISNSKAERLSNPRVVVDQQTLDIEGICHSVATTLCHVTNKTFTFCNDYDIEVLDVCPRSGDVLVLLMMRIEGSEGIKDEVSQLEQYEASVTFVWNLYSGDYKVCMVVPPQKDNWIGGREEFWNPAREASKKFRMKLPADVTLCEPSVRVCANDLALRGISLARIQDLENSVQFVL